MIRLILTLENTSCDTQNPRNVSIYHFHHFSSRNDYFALKKCPNLHAPANSDPWKSVLWCLESLWCLHLSLESKNMPKITKENFTKFAGLKLVFCAISSFFSWKIWWNEVKDQFQTCKFGEIFFSYFGLIFLFQW